ncbi:hypothetical protein D3OALGA1CA_344 [Olavius algarvensis associated proteobacterium Delta 3]|nr:hypothetical protein D3OALGA1CA_344 [Olavius algarvensis associated proteobacterium Delta 3]CAB5100655.1 hypothetical protein D3OALGB2SA_1808 [Olavius algarvensis associated proteobacterium Delta 3]
MGTYVILGSGMLVICMAIQVYVVAVLLHGLDALEQRNLFKHTIGFGWTLIISVVMVLFAGNLLQAALWAWMFLAFQEFKDFGTAFYHSLVNFSTLGYGDIVMSDERRILGALQAANGVFMLGLTTSVLYSFVSALVQRRRRTRKAKHASSDDTGANN